MIDHQVWWLYLEISAESVSLLLMVLGLGLVSVLQRAAFFGEEEGEGDGWFFV